MSTKHFRTGEDYCPSCKHLVDSATPAKGDCDPSPGDVSLCLYCGELLEFNQHLKVVLASEQTTSQLSVKQLAIIATLQREIKLRQV